MKTIPFFSIVMPAFNRAQLIPIAIDSVLRQSFAGFELLIIDDGSTDNIQEVVSRFADDRIRYLRKENEERNRARNFGIEHAQGKYIAFLDSDDYYLENHLHEAHKIITEKNAKVIHLNYRIENSHQDIIRESDLNFALPIAQVLIKENRLSSNGIVIHHEVFNEVRFIDSVDFVVGEDQLLWMQLAVRYSIELSPTVTTVMVEHESRSLRLVDPERYARGLNDLVKHIADDGHLKKFYRKKLNEYLSDKFRFCALLFAIQGKTRSALYFLRKAVVYDYLLIFKRTFWAAVKNLVQRK